VVKRNEEKMEDDRDYTDYMQVKQQPSWLGDSTNERKNNQTADANDNFIKNSSDDYDNNFQNENVPHDHHSSENGTDHYKSVGSNVLGAS
jgi:hypothetical protein